MSGKVLIVEDNADAREMLEVLLRHDGYSVITAEDGEEGLELARAELPDVILTDLHMPRVNGAEMIARLRQTPECLKTPVIVLTADTDGANSMLEAGAHYVLIKPIGFETLADMIKRLVSMSVLIASAIALN